MGEGVEFGGPGGREEGREGGREGGKERTISPDQL